MLALTSDPNDILGTYSLHAGRFYDIRFERPHWVLRCESWVDMVDVLDGYEGPTIIRSDGRSARPVFAHTKIVFEGVKEIQYFREVQGEKQIVKYENLDPETRNRLHPLEQKLADMGLPKPETVDLSVTHEQQLSYEAFLFESTDKRIQDAHNCTVPAGSPYVFHITLDDEHDLQVKIAYEKATVYLGAEG